MSKTQVAIKTIYDEREKFIILGLTGRTGSGCTTVSEILEAKRFDDLNIPEPKTTDFLKNEERKYQIVYNYAKKHWTPFYRISMTDIILSFLATLSLEEFKNLLANIFIHDNDLADNIYFRIIETPNLNDLYVNINKGLNKCIDNESKSLLRDKDNYQREYDLLCNIKKLQKEFRDIFIKYTYNYEIEKTDYKCKEKTGKMNADANAYTYFLQKIGSNIRKSGKVNDGEFDGENMFAISRRANDFIKAIKYVNDQRNESTFICLDAIRNPYEATYFQDRYSSFYLLAVNTENDERIRRLSSKYNNLQIQSLDDIEYPKKIKDEAKFYNQDIGACCQLGDIYLYNPKDNLDFLKMLLIRYITLIKHPGLITPTSVERCMQIAYNAKLNSGCLSRQVGAVVTDKNYSIKSVGWNSTALGQVPCNLRNINNLYINKDRGSFSNYEVNDKVFKEHIQDVYDKFACQDSLDGRLYSYCFKDEYAVIEGQKNQVHTRSIHAEENAFLQIAKYGGLGINGGNLFTTASSCVLCSKKAFQLGIKKIYYIDPYPDIAVPHILDFGTDNDTKPQNLLFYGAIGRAYTNLYIQRIAIKDELKNILNDENASVSTSSLDTQTN